MQFICYKDGWELVPKSVTVRETEIMTLMVCPYCQTTIGMVQPITNTGSGQLPVAVDKTMPVQVLTP